MRVRWVWGSVFSYCWHGSSGCLSQVLLSPFPFPLAVGLPLLTGLLIAGHPRVLADSFPGSAPYEGYNYGSFGTFQSCVCPCPATAPCATPDGCALTAAPESLGADLVSCPEVAPTCLTTHSCLQKMVPDPLTGWLKAQVQGTSPTVTRVSGPGRGMCFRAAVD